MTSFGASSVASKEGLKTLLDIDSVIVASEILESLVVSSRFTIQLADCHGVCCQNRKLTSALSTKWPQDYPHKCWVEFKLGGYNLDQVFVLMNTDLDAKSIRSDFIESVVFGALARMSTTSNTVIDGASMVTMMGRLPLAEQLVVYASDWVQFATQVTAQLESYATQKSSSNGGPNVLFYKAAHGMKATFANGLSTSREMVADEFAIKIVQLHVATQLSPLHVGEKLCLDTTKGQDVVRVFGEKVAKVQYVHNIC